MDFQENLSFLRIWLNFNTWLVTGLVLGSTPYWLGCGKNYLESEGKDRKNFSHDSNLSDNNQFSINEYSDGSPIGYLDIAEPNKVAGWACDPEVPDQSIAVHLYFRAQAGDPNAIGIAIKANVPSENAVNTLCKGGSAHRFEFNPGNLLTQIGIGTFPVYAYGINSGPSGTNILLTDAPKNMVITSTTPPPAQSNVAGWVDYAGEESNGLLKISGWAKDPDAPNSAVTLDVYVDGNKFDQITANLYRSDSGIGKHGYVFFHSTLGKGEHKIEVFANNLDSKGEKDGYRNALLGSPRTVTARCLGLTGDSAEWCNDPATEDYWINREKNTIYLFNSKIKLGISLDMGGTISQLYNNDRKKNLIEEHGGSAIQLSIYGKDEAGLYLNFDACNMGVKTTTIEQRRNAPWNPIQAIHEFCKWTGPRNNVKVISQSENSLTLRITNPFNFFKNADGFSGLTFTQTVTLFDYYAKIDYGITFNGWTYNGKANRINTKGWSQEIPALFTSEGIAAYYYYAKGSLGLPKDPSDSGVNKITTIGNPHIALPQTNMTNWDRNLYLSNPAAKYDATPESWWGACDSTESKCLTVASYSSEIQAVAINNLAQGLVEVKDEKGNVVKDENGNPVKKVDPFLNLPTQGAYITPVGFWGWDDTKMGKGFNKSFTVYLFPYKHNIKFNKQTVRQKILQLKPQ